MRSLSAAGILVLAASVVACTDLTSPDLSDGIQAQPTSLPPPVSPPPDCIKINLDGAPDFCTDPAVPPPPDTPTGNPR